MSPRRMLLPALLCLSFLLAACGGSHVPLIQSMTDVDTAAVRNGEKTLVVMRASTTWGSPAETRWLHVETGELYKVTSQFGASTQEKARDYDIVTLPAGRYILSYILFSNGTKSTWPRSPFDLDPTLSTVSKLGQVRMIKVESDPPTTVYALRSKGLAEDGRTPLIAAFTLTPGKVVYLGDMTVSFTPGSPVQLPGYYPAGTVSFSMRNDLERARLILAKESPELAPQLQHMQITRGSAARQLGSRPDKLPVF